MYICPQWKYLHVYIWKAKTSFLLTISIRLSLEMKACLMMYGYVI